MADIRQHVPDLLAQCVAYFIDKCIFLISALIHVIRSARDVLFPIDNYPTDPSTMYTNSTHYTNSTLYTNWLPYAIGTNCLNAYIFMSPDAKAMADAYAQAQNHNEQQLLFRNDSTQETRPNASSGRPAAADVPMPPKDRDQEPKDNARSISVTISHSFEGANAKGILDQVVHRSMGVAAFRGYGSRRSVSQINVYNSPGASPMVYTDGYSFSMLRMFFTLVLLLTFAWIIVWCRPSSTQYIATLTR